jgi:hypothetical protein
MKFRLLILLTLFGLAVAPVSLFAQAAPGSQASQGPCCPPTGSSTPSGGGGFAADLNPYAGYVWPGNFTGIGNFKGNQVLGVRGGFFVTHGFEIGGNYYWNNHFLPRSGNTGARLAGDLGFPQGAVRANLWELEFTYNFGQRRLLGSAVKPYVVLGGGGLTTRIKDADEFVLNVRSVSTPSGPVFFANDVLDNNDTFFTFSYGGGLKATRLWGPMGVFGDVRGRTVPNFFGNANSWPEVNAGLNFSWGEK